MNRRTALVFDGAQSVGVVGRPEIVTPHDDRVLDVLVVLASHPRRCKTEARVQGLRGGVADPHFERHPLTTVLAGLPAQFKEQLRCDTATLPIGVDGDVRDMRVVGREENPRVTNQPVIDHSDDVITLVTLDEVEFGSEYTNTPRARIHDLFDRHDAT